MDKSFIKKLIPILLSNLVCWFYAISSVVLGYLYNAFPGQDALVALMASIPGLFCMAAGFAAAPLMRRLNKKTVVIIGLVSAIVGGLMVRYLGSGNLIISVIGSGITGIPAGLISSTNYAALAEISPDNMRDKVCGWGDVLCTVGMGFSTFIAGLLATEADWARIYDVFYIPAIVLVIVVLFYPSIPPAAEPQGAAEADDSSAQERVGLPGAIIGLLAVKFLAGCFYMASTYCISDLVINETQMGTSVLAGNCMTAFSAVAIVAGLLVFVWIRTTKGLSLPLVCWIGAVLYYLTAKAGSPMLMVVMMALLGFVQNTIHSTSSTLVTMASPGRSVEIATSLFVAISFFGEFCGAYVPGMVANLIFGNSLPSSCFIAGAIGLCVVGDLSYPFCKKAYKLAFGDGEQQ